MGEHHSREQIKRFIISAMVANSNGEGMAVPAGVAADEILALLGLSGSGPSPAEAEIARLRDHISEQTTHVEIRIKDGEDMTPRVWRIALEDIVRENRKILEPRP